MIHLLVSNPQEAHAVSLPVRFQILETLLVHGSLSNGEIKNKLGEAIAYSTLNYHMVILEKSGFIVIQELIPKRGSHIKKYGINRGKIVQ